MIKATFFLETYAHTGVFCEKEISVIPHEGDQIKLMGALETVSVVRFIYDGEKETVSIWSRK